MSIDYNHSQWAAISQRLAEQLDALKERLIRPTLTETETATIRGEIKAVRTILNWPEQDKPNQPVEGMPTV